MQTRHDPLTAVATAPVPGLTPTATLQAPAPAAPRKGLTECSVSTKGTRK